MQKLNKVLIYKMMAVGLSCVLILPAATADLSIVKILLDKGIATTQGTPGYMYRTGDGISQDDAKAFQWTQEAANRGHEFSQYRLGKMYSNGTGVRQNFAKAIEWYEKAANQGNAEIQFNLGTFYQNGKGIPQDYDKAVEWYQKSADKGFA